MESIAPEFSNENERNIVLAIFFITLFTGFWVPGAAYLFFKNMFSPNAFALIRAILNFDIMLLLVWAIIFVMTFVVGLAAFLMNIIWIAHLVVVVLAIIAIVNKQRVEIPVPLKIFQ